MQSFGLLHQLPPPPPGKTGWPWTEETDPGLFSPEIDWPKISIVTPSYNQGEFIEETIRSVILQNYPNLEYVVIDGGSTDESVEIIRKYERWIDFWVSEKDRGQSEAINKGFKKCSGTWFAWINSDDYLYKEALLNILENNLSGKKIVIGSGNLVDIFRNLIHTKKASLINFKDLIKWGKVPNQPSVFMTYELFQSVSGVRNDFHYALDWRLWVDLSFRIKKSEQLILSDKILAASRIWPGMKTQNGTFKGGFREVLLTFKEYKKNGTLEDSHETELAIFENRKRFATSTKDLLLHTLSTSIKFCRPDIFLKCLKQTVIKKLKTR